MKLTELKSRLEANPARFPRFHLPDGDQIPAHFHLTEVGYEQRKFIDCGGVTGEREACVLQTWLGSDLDHRLTAGRMAKILALGERVLPPRDFEVQVEYDCCVVAQYPIVAVRPSGEFLEIELGNTRTQCLARERREAASGRSTETACC